MFEHGTMVQHEWLPGVYRVIGSPIKNEIGYVLLPTLSEKGDLTYFHPHNLKVCGPSDGRKGDISRTPGRAKNPLLGESRGRKRALINGFFR